MPPPMCSLILRSTENLGTKNSIPIPAIIALVVGLCLIMGICLLPTGCIVHLYDWIRRGFKAKPVVKSQIRPYVFFNADKRAEAEQKRREEEEANKPFLLRHLETLRAWRKPAESPQDPEIALKAAPEPAVPLQVAKPSYRYSRSYESFQRYLKEEGAQKI